MTIPFHGHFPVISFKIQCLKKLGSHNMTVLYPNLWCVIKKLHCNRKTMKCVRETPCLSIMVVVLPQTRAVTPKRFFRTSPEVNWVFLLTKFQGCIFNSFYYILLLFIRYSRILIGPECVTCRKNINF